MKKFSLFLLSMFLVLALVACDGFVPSATTSLTEEDSTVFITEAPTTEVPTTEVPTSEAPTTEEPTTEVPTTEVPTSEAHTTESPSTEEPTTEEPVTAEPTTEIPTTEIPSYSVNLYVNGVLYSTIAFNEGELLSLPTLGDTYQLFSGWFEDEVLTIPFTMTIMPNQTVILYASLVDLPRAYPLVVYAVETPPLQLVKAGTDFLVFLTQDGRVLTMGENTVSQLGDSSLSSSTELAYDITPLFMFESDEQVKHIHVSHHNAILVTTKERVFTWGSNAFGQLGIGFFLTNSLSAGVHEITNHVPLQEGETIEFAYAGNTSYLTTSLNRVFAWGSNAAGELGDGTTVNQHTPIETTVHYQLNGANIVRFIASVRSVYLLTSDNRLLVHGLNIGGLPVWVTGNVLTPENVLPRIPLTSGEQIIDIQRGELHIQILTSKSRIIAHGNNDYHQFGTGYQNTFFNPTAVDMPIVAGEEILSIHVGSFHTVFQTSTNRVLSYGNLISEDPTHRAVIEVLFPYQAHHRIIDIDVSERANYAIDDQGRILVWGRDTIFGTLLTPIEKTLSVAVGSVQSIMEGSPVLVDEPSREGYRFAGWYVDLDLTTPWNEAIMPNEAVALYPKWEPTFEMHLLENDMLSFKLATYGPGVILAVTYDNQFYMWGGSSTAALHSITPKNITLDFDLDQDDEFVQISVGNTHVLVLTKHGRIFGLGENYELDVMYYPLTVLAGMYPYRGGTFFNNKISRPLELTHLFALEEGETLQSLFSSEYSNLITTTHDRVFMFGPIQALEWHSFSDIRTPSRIEPLPVLVNDFLGLAPGETVIDFHATMWNFMVLTSNHRVLIWGENNNGLLLDSALTRSYHVLDITSKLNLATDEWVIQLAIDQTSVAILTNQNRVIRYGYTYYSDGTSSKSAPFDVSSAFTLLEDETILAVIGDSQMTMILTSMGRMLSFGRSTARNGIGDSFTYRNAVDITSRFSSETNFVYLEMNSFNPLALTSQGDIFVWGNSLRIFEDGSTQSFIIPTQVRASADRVIGTIQFDEPRAFTDVVQDLERVGFIFDGWYEDLQRTIPFQPDIVRDGSFSLYAKWETLYFTIAFDTQSGTPIEMMELPYDVIIPKPADPIRIGYTFIGWYEDEGFTIPFTSERMPARMISLYAKYEPKTYALQQYMESMVQAETVYSGTNHTILITLDHEIYLFGYYDEVSYGFPILLNPYLQLSNGETIVSVAMGEEHFFLLTSQGRLFAYGRNTEGVFGSTSYAWADQPIEVTSSYPLDEDDQIIGVYTHFYQSMVLTKNGRVFSSGQNYQGNLAIGDNLKRDDAVEVSANFDLQEGERILNISLGEFHGFAWTNQNRVFLWGFELIGYMGNDRNLVSHPLPIDVTNRLILGQGETIQDIQSGHLYSVFLTSTGRVFTYGINEEGQLGNNKATSVAVNPIDITATFDLENGEFINQITVGIAHALFLTNQGQVFALGDGAFGALGLGNQANAITPKKLAGKLILHDLEFVAWVHAGGDQSFLVTNQGRLFGFGENSYNQLGDRTFYSLARDITDAFHHFITGERVASVAVGFEHSIMLSTEGNIYTWGSNYYGQLGTGSTNHNLTTYRTMNHVNLLYKVQKVIAGANFNLYFGPQSILYTFGNNSFGQLGNNDFSYADKLTPVRIDTQFGLRTGELLLDADAGAYHAIAITNQHRVFTWGYGGYGALGTGFTSNYGKPIDITDRLGLHPGEDAIRVVAGSNQSFVLTSHQRLLGFGLNAYGALGIHSHINQTIAVDITPFIPLASDEWIVEVFSKGEATMVISNQGRVFVTGSNIGGKLGIGTSEPMLNFFYYANDAYGLNEGETIVKADFGGEVGGFGVFLTNQNRLFFMGITTNHMLFNQSGTSRYFATEITDYFPLYDNDEIVDIALGNYHSIVTTKHGRLLAWGHELYYHQFPTAVNHSSYASTDALPLLENEEIFKLINGEKNSIILTNLGRVFISGDGSKGQFLNGSWNHQAGYVEVGQYIPLESSEVIMDIAFGRAIYAITSHQRILMWGRDTFTVEDVSHQIDLQADEFFELITSDGVATTAVLTTQGRLFMVGRNQGIFGNNDTNDQADFVETTSFYALAVSEKIIDVSISNTHSMVLTNHNRLFTAGFNTQGALGDNSTIKRITPVDISNRYTLLEGEDIVKIGTGLDFSGFLTSQNRMFTWGSVIYGQSGQTSSLLRPTELSAARLGLTTNELPVDFSIGFYNTFVLTNQGRIIGWGDNDEGQLHQSFGYIRRTPSDLTRFIGLYPNESIQLMNHGYLFGTIITSNQRILSIGYNAYGQLGRGVVSNYYIPKEIVIHKTTLLQYSECTYQSLLDLADAPEISGYEFVYWSTDPFGILRFEEEFMPARIVSLYAIYRPLT